MSTQKQLKSKPIDIRIGESQIKGYSDDPIILEQIKEANKRENIKEKRANKGLLLQYLKWLSTFLITIMVIMGTISLKTGGLAIVPLQLEKFISFVEKKLSG